MSRSTNPTGFFAPVILVLVLMTVYWLTMAPGLTWANQGSDGGDLIAAAATNGVAHPTGYPVYLAFARLFQLAPVGSLAFRTNLMSVFAAISTCLLVYHLVTRSLAPFTGSQIWLAGLASAYALGFSPLFWSQAVITEVYTLHALFVAILLTLSTDHSSLNIAQKRKDGLLGLVFGLSLGNHVTTLLFLPLFLSSVVQIKPNSTGEPSSAKHFQLDSDSLVRRFSWMAAGLLTYLTLPLRALSHPPVNWGNPVALDGFLWLVSGKLYQDQLFILSLSAWWGRIQIFAALLLEQFGPLGLIIGLIGLIVYYSPTRLYHNTIWIGTAFSVFAIGYVTNDSVMYLIPTFLCFAIWIGLGLGGLMDAAAQKLPKLGFAIGLVFILYLFVQAGGHWTRVDASQDLRAEQFGRDVLAQAPAHAIVFAKGDRAVFAMWYFHYALHDRPDIVVIATDLLPYEWYQDTLRHTYPALRLPAYFPFPESVIDSNPDRNICYIQDDRSPRITCTQQAGSADLSKNGSADFVLTAIQNEAAKMK